MATAIAPRTDIYLTVLAGRALTALADLAADGSAWNERIRKDLESGIAYCEAVCAYDSTLAGTKMKNAQQALRRSTTDESTRATATADLSAQCQTVEALLREWLARSASPEMSDLLTVIRFFSDRVGHESR